MRHNELSGLAMALFCAIVWGAGYPISAVLAGKLDPVVFAIVRYGLSTLGILIFFLLNRKRHWLQLRDIPVMIISGIAAHALYFYFSLMSLETISAAEAGVINGMIPIFTVLVSIPVYRRLPNHIQTFAVIMSFAGATLIAFDPSNKFTGINIGHLYAILGVLGFILSCFVNKSLATRYDGISTMLYQFLFATLALMLVLPFREADMSQANVIFDNDYYLFCTLMLGLVSSGLAYVLYFNALHLIGVERANMVQNLIPLSAFFFSYTMLDEAITQQKALGIVIVIISLIIFDITPAKLKSRFRRRVL